MLSGDKPYVGETTDAILQQHCEAPLPRLAESFTAYQPLLDRLLAKEPAQRLANARELIEAIEDLAAAARPTLPYGLSA